MPFSQPPPLKATMFGKMPVPGRGKGGGGPPAPKGPKGVRLEHRIGIQAPSDTIWDVLYDLEGWADWNPLFPQAAGVIRIGEKLRLTQVVPGQRPQEIEPTLLEWVPREQLHWKLAMLGGLITAIHYVEIEQLAEASCIVSNGEIIGGMMGASLARRMAKPLHRGLREMNEALKDRAEALWRTQQAAAG